MKSVLDRHEVATTPWIIGPRWVVVAMLITVAGLSIPYVLAISPYWNITPDSADYVGGAKSLAAGEGYTLLGRPIFLQPPVTSLMYASALWLFPEGYLSLRIVTIVFLFLALAGFFFVARRDLEPLPSLAVIVLSLASVSLLRESTQTLSEIFYLFFSIVALVLAAASWARADGWGPAVTLGLALLLAAMTRIVGLILPVVVLAWHGIRLLRHEERFRPRLAAAAAAALAVTVLWDLRSLYGAGYSHFKLMMQREPWVDEAGYVSPFDLVVRLFVHISELGQIGWILSNGGVPGFPQASAALALLGAVSFLGGLAVSVFRGLTPTNLYVLAYLFVSLTYYPEVMPRFFTPIIPFLFHYAVVGLVELGHGVRHPRTRGVARAALALWGVAYALAGLPAARAEIREQHQAPFGDYPIKYSWNYDAERLALWLRDQSDRDTRYVSPFPDVYDFITERRSLPIPLTRDREVFLARLEEAKIRYVLVSLKENLVREFLLPVIAHYPERFVLIRAEAQARLYEYRPP